ncbi:MAG TPA: hypothetical protein VJG64_02205 [Candidatus Paceibacterota bacterium]
MNVVTIPKRAYDEIIKRQTRTEATVKHLVHAVKELSQDEELRPEVVARIDRHSLAMDAGKGKRLKTVREVRAYFRSL